MSDPCVTTYGPCAPYATVEDVGLCGCSGFDLSPESPDLELIEAALLWASRRLFEASGGLWWGCCPVEVAPCRPVECGAPPGKVYPPPELAGWPYPSIPWGLYDASGHPAFLNVWACGCSTRTSCSCGAVGDRLVLPWAPVRSVEQVTIDGLTFTDWRIDPDGALVRTDGLPWPSCQNLDAPLGSPGTWSVVYRFGYTLPPEAVPLVASYACELAKRCRGADCSLPAGVQVIQRDGVEFAVAEPSDYRDRRLTGFGPLDDWLALMFADHVRPDLAPRRARVALPPELA